jgi:hypothetical protein
MRVRTFINRVVWLVVIGSAGYGAIAAGSSYLQVRGLVDQAVDEASKRPRTTAAATQPGAALQEFAADTRTALLLGARRVGFDLLPQKLLIEPRDGGIRVRFHWSCVLWTVADEAVLAFPLWVDRTYTLKT